MTSRSLTKHVHEMANFPAIDAPSRGPRLPGRRRRRARRPRARGRRRGRPALPRSRHGSGRTRRHLDLRSDPLPAVASTSLISSAAERARFYRESTRDDGSLLREYEIFAVDREIEIAPGLVFPAWTFNGQVPGPTLRATEGDRVRVRFVNQGTHPHTLHFHGWHPPAMDGSLPEHQVAPGGEFLYEFDAEPFGLHLYHCHAIPSEAAHPQGSLRRLPGRPQAGPSAGRRDGDGDERVRHQLRRRQRSVRGQHRRVPPHDRADPGQGRRAGAHQPGQRHRVRPDQQPAPPRHVLRRLPHRHPPRDRARPPTP